LNAVPSQPDTSYTYNNDNRLLTAGSAAFEYDNNGNLITKTLGGNVTNYTWDFNDMLTQLSTGGNTYVYRYDGLGNRVARIENSEEKTYVGGLAETDASGNITSYYVYGLGLISKITPTNQTYYYRFDAIGNTVAISDSTGNMVNKYAYDAFGEVLNQEEAIPNPFKYVGQFGVMDEGNGLLFMKARYYDPEIGRFISKDPIGLLGGLNLYAYAGNNPVNFIDPLGLQGEKSGIWSGTGGNVGGILLSGGVYTGIYRVTSWDTGQSCWIMTTCSGTGLGLTGSLTAESIWIWNAYSSSDLAGLTEGAIASGGKGIVAAGGSYSAGGCGNPITGPISNPSPSKAITFGAGVGGGAGYIIGGCKTTVLSRN